MLTLLILTRTREREEKSSHTHAHILFLHNCGFCSLSCNSNLPQARQICSLHCIQYASSHDSTWSHRCVFVCRCKFNKTTWLLYQCLIISKFTFVLLVLNADFCHHLVDVDDDDDDDDVHRPTNA